MNIVAVNKASGEYISLPVNTSEEIVRAYLVAAEYEKVAKSLKDQVKQLLPTIVDEQGRTPEVDGYVLKRYESQRMTYNKGALREVFDEDELDLFMDVSKGKVDAYIKDNQLTDEQIETLRAALEPNGQVVSSFRKERV